MNLKRAVLVVLAVLVSGCGVVSQHAIVVPLGEPLILLEAVKLSSRVLVANQHGEWVEASVDEIPAGFACLAPDQSDFE